MLEQLEVSFHVALAYLSSVKYVLSSVKSVLTTLRLLTVLTLLSPMEDITLILLVGAVLFYIVSMILRRQELNWLTLVVSVCAMGGIILDDALDTTQLLLLIIPDIYIMFMSGLKVMGLVGSRD